MKIKSGDRVVVNVVGKTASNEEFINSSEDGPIEFIVGKFNLIKGLNNAVVNLALNEEKNVELMPEDAFGNYDKNLVLHFPLNKLSNSAKVGDLFEDGKNGGFFYIKKIDKKKNQALMDGNHILAGQKIFLKIMIVSINPKKI